MANPVFNSSEIFGEPRRGRAGTATPQSAVQYGTAGQAGMDAATLEQMYGAPSATTRDTARLSYDDVIIKTSGLLALLVAVAAVTWFVAPGLFWVGMIVGLVLGLVNAFKREPSPVLIVLYTVAEGVFLGGISLLFQNFVVAEHDHRQRRADRPAGGARHVRDVRCRARAVQLGQGPRDPEVHSVPDHRDGRLPGRSRC